ncbi:MAG TPA: serine hydrolase [Gaiellaceae bacterium]|nr:serine hydrolase [Gaiellaceae bacterium]
MRLVWAVSCLAVSCCLAGSAAAAPPQVDARAWMVENPVTGEVLLTHAARERVPIASITKLMTVIVALQHLNLNEVVGVDPRAAAVGQETIYLEARQQITVSDLVKAALIQSANDAADALALATAPSFPDFALLMNAEARKLGLTDSHFVRPDGLDAAGEYSSARDVTRLAIAAMKIPTVRAAVDEVTVTIENGSRELHTWDDLLGVVPGVFGVKTGHTSAAGWNQVSAIRGDDTTIYATILGSPSRAQRNTDLETLLIYGIAQYRQVRAIAAGRRYAAVNLPFGRPPLALVARLGLQAVVRVNEPLTERVVAPISVSLPVRLGQVLGQVEVWSRGRLLGRRPLVASRTVPAPGLAGRIAWYARRTVHEVVDLLT